MWPAYVINLARNTTRMKNAAAALGAERISFERIEGVNGWELPEEEIERVYDREANARRGRKDLVKPEIGCYLSHVDAWRRIASGSAAGGFVFEDDFATEAGLGALLELLSDDPARDWDMVKLFSFDVDPRCVKRRLLAPGIEIVEPYRVPTCLIGYGLTRDAATRLVARSIPFFRPVDEDQKFVWETGLRVALVLPPPLRVGDQQAETGTIGNERRSHRGGKSFLRGLRYQLRYAGALHWHRLFGTGR